MIASGSSGELSEKKVWYWRSAYKLRDAYGSAVTQAINEWYCARSLVGSVYSCGLRHFRVPGLAAGIAALPVIVQGSLLSLLLYPRRVSLEHL